MPITTNFNIIKDSNGTVSYTLGDSNKKYSGLFAAGVAQSVTCPDEGGKYIVIISASNGADFIVATNGETAALATGAIAASTSTIGFDQIHIGSGEEMSIVTPQDDVQISVRFYKVTAG